MIKYVISLQSFEFMFAGNSIDLMYKVSNSIPNNEVFSFSMAVLSPEFSCMSIVNNNNTIYIVHIKHIKTG